MQKLKIYAAKLIDADAADLIPLLDRSRQEKIASMKNQRERLRSISAGLLLRYAFLQSGYSQAQWQQVVIVQGEYGKPAIKDFSEFHYSISHSEDWIICAAGDLSVGADIQRMRPWRIQMAKRFYSDIEYDRLVRLDSAQEQTKHFYKMWTAKESCVKLTGRGIGAGISQYVTDEDFRHICEADGASLPIRIYDTIEGYTICVCSREVVFPERLTFIDLRELQTIYKVEGIKC